MVKGITYILDNNVNVQGLVGRNKDNTKYKVFPVVAGQQEEAPYIVVRRIGHIPQQCKQGRATTYDDTYQVVSFAKNFEDAVGLDRVVIDALDGVSGVNNGVYFQQIRHENSFDGGFDEDRELFFEVSTFTSTVNEDQTT